MTDGGKATRCLHLARMFHEAGPEGLRVSFIRARYELNERLLRRWLHSFRAARYRVVRDGDRVAVTWGVSDG